MLMLHLVSFYFHFYLALYESRKFLPLPKAKQQWMSAGYVYILPAPSFSKQKVQGVCISAYGAGFCVARSGKGGQCESLKWQNEQRVTDPRLSFLYMPYLLL